MFPTLIDFGTWDLPLLGETHLFLPTYGVLFAASVVVAWWWFLRRGRQLEVAEQQLFNLSFYTILAGILGAKLALVLVDWRTYLEHPGELWGTLRSAGVLMGGVIAGAGAFVYYARREGLPLFRLGDAIAAPLAFAQAFGRLGCFTAGCCWGKPTDPHNPIAVVFTRPDALIDPRLIGVPLVPTQLLQMANDLLLAAVLAWLWRRRVEPPGTVFWIYMIAYSLGRGIIEFWRGDVGRGLYFGDHVSTSQLLSIFGLVFGLAMLLRGRRRQRSAAPAVPARARR
jgi:phosphatidylglycerol:prolipoprotein diacylglycerol transferase